MTRHVLVGPPHLQLLLGELRLERIHVDEWKDSSPNCFSISIDFLFPRPQKQLSAAPKSAGDVVGDFCSRSLTHGAAPTCFFVLHAHLCWEKKSVGLERKGDEA